MKLVLQMTLALVLAFSLLTLSGWALTAFLVHQGAKAITETLEISQQEAEHARQIAERRRLQIEAQKLAQARAQRQEQARKAAAESAKRAAWSRYYQDSPECLNPRSERHAVECVNRKMRARDQFNQQYRP
ncbi:MAG: hypothetical protein CME40_15770 [Haliea sp.]|nr:hypothetical protein [Haliea sp.]